VLHIVVNARIEWIVKGIFVGISGYFLLLSTMKPGIKFLLRGIVVAVLLVFVPHIPLAMTAKYTYYTSVNMIGYVTTFFSLFGVMLLITLLIGFLINLFDFKPVVKKIAGAVILVPLITISILTDFTNYHIAKDIHSANIRVYAVDELIRSEQFQQIPEGAKLYSGDLYFNASYTARNLTEQAFEWKYYILEKTKKYWDFIREEKDFREAAKDTTQPLYYVAMRQAIKTDDLSIAIGKIGQNTLKDSVMKPMVNRVLILYYSTYKTFSVSFRCNTASPDRKIPLVMNNFKDTIPTGKMITYSISNTKEFQPSTIFTIDADSIDLKSIMISNMLNPESKTIYL